MILLMKVMKMIMMMKVMKTDADEGADDDEDVYSDSGADDDMFTMVPMMLIIIFKLKMI